MKWQAAQRPSLRSHSPVRSDEITTLSRRTSQSVLAHPRCIAPARLELARRSCLFVVESQDRLIGCIVVFACGKSIVPLQPQTTTWVLPTTAGMSPLGPQGIEPYLYSKVYVNHTAQIRQAGSLQCCWQTQISTHRLIIMGIVP